MGRGGSCRLSLLGSPWLHTAPQMLRPPTHKVFDLDLTSGEAVLRSVTLLSNSKIWSTEVHLPITQRLSKRGMNLCQWVMNIKITHSNSKEWVHRVISHAVRGWWIKLVKPYEEESWQCWSLTMSASLNPHSSYRKGQVGALGEEWVVPSLRLNARKTALGKNVLTTLLDSRNVKPLPDLINKVLLEYRHIN